MHGQILALARSAGHHFSKHGEECLRLIAGRGVAGDAHAGTTVRHRSRMAADPAQPNLRQVHLLPGELLDALNAEGFALEAGALGENITTSGLDLLALPTGTVLRIGAEATLRITGLRNPCWQIEAYRTGLLKRVARRRTDGSVERLAGVMSIVQTGGTICVGDTIAAEWPPAPHRPLHPV